ncbi:Bax inhibitor 1 [Branchiostoma belcheri]|nr:Bax inhibitor 1 [Branchiostoma belcheri]
MSYRLSSDLARSRRIVLSRERISKWRRWQGTMGRKLRHLLIFLLIILKEPNMPDADYEPPSIDCTCRWPSSPCRRDFSSIPQNLRKSISKITAIPSGTFAKLPKLEVLILRSNQITTIPSGTFANLPQLQELDLHYNQITTIHYGALENLPQLRTLFLSSNQITTMPFGTFANLPKLQKLDLYKNRITTIPSGTFAQLPQLQTLFLSRNQITTISSGTFANLSQLQDLWLNGNQITTIPSGTFANLFQLQDLRLNDNQITTIPSDTFANLPQLQDLRLNGNQITAIDSGTFANIPQLQTLFLSWNQITTIPSGTLANLSQLQDLLLNSNQITTIDSGTFAHLPQLQTLFLSRNQITTIPSGTFANLPQLQKLFLDKNQITTIHSGAFGNLPLFKRLKLQNNNMSAIPLSVFCLFPSNITIELEGNPWQCDCRMVPVRLIPAFKDQIICAQPDRVQGQKLAHVDSKELVCKDPTFQYHWYFKFNAVPISDPDSTLSPVGKTRETPASPLAITSDKPESAPSSPLPVLIRYSCGPVAGIVLIVTFLAIIWNKRRTRNPPLGGNKNTTATVLASGDSHQYEDIDNPRVKTGQGQSQAITASTTNTTATVLASSDDHQYEDIDNPRVKTGQGQSQANTESSTNTTATVLASSDDHQYEDIDNPRVETGQGQSQANTESSTNTTATVLASSDDHQYEDIDNPRVETGQGQSQVNTESSTNTTATVLASGDDHQYEDVDKPRVKTGQGQSQANTESNTNTTAAVMASGDSHQYEDVDNPRVETGQGQSQAITASTTNTTTTVLASGDDHQYEDIDNPRVKTGQGQSQAITASTTNTTAIVMARVHDNMMIRRDDQTGQGQSQAVTESLDVRNLSYGTGPIASQHDSIYKDVAQSQAITNTAVIMTSDQYRTGRSQHEVIITESFDARNLSYDTGPTASQSDTLYKTAPVMASGHDQTGQVQSHTTTESNTNTTATVMTRVHDNIGQSHANATSLTVANLSHSEVLAALQPNTMYVDVKAPTKNKASTEMSDQTEQVQSQSNIQSLKVGNLSHNDVLAALQPNTMYVDVKAPPKNEASTKLEMASGHDQTEQVQSQSNIQSLKVGNLSHNDVLAALQPNTMYVDVKASPKNEASAEMASGHDQTGQGQSQANIQSLNVGNLSHNEVLAALQPNTMYVDVKTPTKDEASTEMASGHDQTGQGQSQANIQSLNVGNLSHNEVLAALQPNTMYVDVKTPTKDEASTEMASGHDQTE